MKRGPKRPPKDTGYPVASAGKSSAHTEASSKKTHGPPVVSNQVGPALRTTELAAMEQAGHGSMRSAQSANAWLIATCAHSPHLVDARP